MVSLPVKSATGDHRIPVVPMPMLVLVDDAALAPARTRVVGCWDNGHSHGTVRSSPTVVGSMGGVARDGGDALGDVPDGARASKRPCGVPPLAASPLVAG